VGNILIKAFSFILIILLGYILKQIGFVNQNEQKLISKIVLNITLPAAIINNFVGFEMKISLLFIVFFGILGNIITSVVGYLSSIKKNKTDCFFRVINLSGYNIGCFTMPYIQSFLGSFSVIITSIFDIGNGIMCSGGTEAILSGILSNDKTSKIGKIFKNIIKSVPVDACILMLVLSVMYYIK